jgi:hypothetical protein
MKRRRVIVGVVVLALVAGVVCLWAAVPSELTAADADRVRVGMTLAQVERQLGRPDQIDPRSKSKPAAGPGAVPFGQVARWNAQAGHLIVGLEDEVVVYVGFYQSPPLPSQGLRGRLGL